MVRERERRRGLLLARVALAVTLLASGVVLLGRQGALLLHQCVPGDGTAGLLGLRLAVLRADSACPTGTLAVGGEGDRVMGVLVIVALPLLLIHLAGLGAGFGLLARLHAALRAAGVVLAAVLPHLPRSSALRVRFTRGPAVGTRTLGVVERMLAAPWRRGPPALGLA